MANEEHLAILKQGVEACGKGKIRLNVSTYPARRSMRLKPENTIPACRWLLKSARSSAAELKRSFGPSEGIYDHPLMHYLGSIHQFAMAVGGRIASYGQQRHLHHRAH